MAAQVRETPAAMGRMHSKGKGMSSSALPYKRSAPSWLKTSPQEVRRLLTLRVRSYLPAMR